MVKKSDIPFLLVAVVVISLVLGYIRHSAKKQGEEIFAAGRNSALSEIDHSKQEDPFIAYQKLISRKDTKGSLTIPGVIKSPIYCFYCDLPATKTIKINSRRTDGKWTILLLCTRPVCQAFYEHHRLLRKVGLKTVDDWRREQ